MPTILHLFGSASLQLLPIPLFQEGAGWTASACGVYAQWHCSTEVHVYIGTVMPSKTTSPIRYQQKLLAISDYVHLLITHYSESSGILLAMLYNTTFICPLKAAY